jgi:hypothetical protein
MRKIEVLTRLVGQLSKTTVKERVRKINIKD